MRRERERTFRNESGAKGPGNRAMTRMIVLNKKLYVGNIPFTCTEADLKDLFGRHGQVASVKVITDRETGRPRGFAFVEMDANGATEAMRALDGSQFGGRPLRVNAAVTAVAIAAVAAAIAVAAAEEAAGATKLAVSPIEKNGARASWRERRCSFARAAARESRTSTPRACRAPGTSSPPAGEAAAWAAAAAGGSR
jgi:RNA recognition motif-containing protein